MGSLKELTTEATLADLPRFNFRVTPDTFGQDIADAFDRYPELPGAIIERGSELIGTISRRQFHERMSSRYGLELFLKRPISTFLQVAEFDLTRDLLQLSHTERVDEAVRQGLSRSPAQAYDPIVVVISDPNLPEVQTRSLVDFQVLLLAQSQILERARQGIHKQWKRTKRYMHKLDKERNRVKEYATLLEQQQDEIQHRNHILETQKAELERRSDEIVQLNRRFIRIGHWLSAEGKRAFEATFQGAASICENTDRVVYIGQLLSEELKTIHSASETIDRIGNQVRHLAVKAAIVANHNKELNGFSYVTDEIGKLVNQTLEAGRHMERVATRFRDRIQTFTDSAKAGMNVARSLVLEIERAEAAIAELENLVRVSEEGDEGAVPNTTSPLLAISQSSEAEGDRGSRGTTVADVSVLHSKIQHLETALSTLDRAARSQDSHRLIRKIQRLLEQQTMQPSSSKLHTNCKPPDRPSPEFKNSTIVASRLDSLTMHG